MNVTTGGFTSAQLMKEEHETFLASIDELGAIELGEIALSLAKKRLLAIVFEVRIRNRIIYRAAMPGTSEKNDNWILRKGRVVSYKNHSTLYERVLAEELGIDWFESNLLSEDDYAIHGGGLPLIVNGICEGALIISGLPQIEDHRLGIEVIKEFISRSKIQVKI